jgi:hypothetical protein
MKWIFTLFVLFCSFLSLNASACEQALANTNPGFCSSFKSVAKCHCVELGLPKGMCDDMNALYGRMMFLFGNSLQKVCEYQHDTTTQTCIDDWNCYRLGGKNSQGALCSSTGKACP